MTNLDETDEFEPMSLQSVEMLTQPPLGCRPRWIWREIVSAQRTVEILEAIDRYQAAETEVPEEWIDELLELRGFAVDAKTLKAIARAETAKENI